MSSYKQVNIKVMETLTVKEEIELIQHLKKLKGFTFTLLSQTKIYKDEKPFETTTLPP